MWFWYYYLGITGGGTLVSEIPLADTINFTVQIKTSFNNSVEITQSSNKTIAITTQLNNSIDQ